MYFELLSIVDWLKEWDQWLFIKINRDTANPFFDFLMPWLRQANIWIPLYAFMMTFVLINFTKQSGWWILLFICTVALTDMIGNHGFKNNFQRLRPCNDPDFYPYVRLLLNQCAGGFSFTSNHAANHFGMGFFTFFTFRKYFPKWAWIGLAWAAAICFAQIYVGVHYPLDIAGGALLGLACGGLTAYLFNQRWVLQ